jgi:hypothetical protein
MVNRRGSYFPCPKCYRYNGYCKRCFGTGTNFRNGRPCKNCNNGMYIQIQKHGHKKHHSSSSDDDWW